MKIPSMKTNCCCIFFITMPRFQLFQKQKDVAKKSLKTKTTTEPSTNNITTPRRSSITPNLSTPTPTPGISPTATLRNDSRSSSFSPNKPRAKQGFSPVSPGLVYTSPVSVSSPSARSPFGRSPSSRRRSSVDRRGRKGSVVRGNVYCIRAVPGKRALGGGGGTEIN